MQQIVQRKATIGIIGLGYTGLSLAHDFGTVGFQIIGFDIDGSKIDMLQKRQSYLPFMPHDQLFSLLDAKKFIPTSNPSDLAAADIFIISVPTPLSVERQPDITYIKKAAATVAAAMKLQPARVGGGKANHEPEQPRLVILQSTTYPGTTEEEVLPILEKESGLQLGKDFFLAHVPEREDAGIPDHSELKKIPRICGGVTPESTELAKALYEAITVKVHSCPSARVAEATKIYENSYRLINIAFVDEMKMVFDKLGINIWDVIQAASTKPFGFNAFYPGPGIGGECIPVDPLYMEWRAKQFGIPTKMIHTASEINLETHDYIVEKIADALKKNQKSLKGAKILILGVAFKKDVSDIRESPALRIMEILKKRGAEVSYHDYFVPELKNWNLKSIALDENSLKNCDCVVITTDHSQYDWNWICQQSPLVVDTRNATQSVSPAYRTKIIL